MNFQAIADKSKVDLNGRIYIPKVIREQIKAKEGDKVEVLADQENRAVLIRLEDKQGA